MEQGGMWLENEPGPLRKKWGAWEWAAAVGRGPDTHLKSCHQEGSCSESDPRTSTVPEAFS